MIHAMRILSPLCRRGLLALCLALPMAACTTLPAEKPARTVSPQEIREAMYARAKVLYQSKDYQGAGELMRTLAGRGYAPAQYALGYMYYYGKGMPRNEKEALRWITTAAAQGYAKAEAALRMLERGEKPLP